ncbi:MAG: F0F1 ATP synthase subunit A [Kineosporiaceae bacterium]
MSVLLAARADSFEAPGVHDFWQPLIGDGAYALTRPSVVMAISVVLIIAFLTVLARRLTVVPGKAQFLAESAYGLVRNSVARDIIGSKEFLKFVPFLFTLFTVLLVNNLFGVIPFIQFPTTSRIAFPIALTILVYIVYQTVSFRRKGVVGYMKSLVPPGLPGWILPLMWPLEFITYFITRPVTLALRLFGNMFAGHLLLLVFTLGGEYLLLHSTTPNKAAGALSFLFTIVMSFFEVLVEFLQAYIFTLLAALYLAGAVSDEH